jgi:hypothetical protein
MQSGGGQERHSRRARRSGPAELRPQHAGRGEPRSHRPDLGPALHKRACGAGESAPRGYPRRARSLRRQRDDRLPAGFGAQGGRSGGSPRARRSGPGAHRRRSRVRVGDGPSSVERRHSGGPRERLVDPALGGRPAPRRLAGPSADQCEHPEVRTRGHARGHADHLSAPAGLSGDGRPDARRRSRADRLRRCTGRNDGTGRSHA